MNNTLYRSIVSPQIETWRTDQINQFNVTVIQIIVNKTGLSSKTKGKAMAEKSEAKRQELTPDAKNMIVEMSKSGCKQAQIAKKVGKSQSTICKFLKRLNARGTIENEARSGRPQKMNSNSRHALRFVVQHDKNQTLTEIVSSVNEKIPVNVSKRTVQRHLQKLGFKKRIRKNNPSASNEVSHAEHTNIGKNDASANSS